MENIILSSIDEYQLSINVYEVSNPKGYVQVIHGMQEHQNRYIELAKCLNDNGYTVITSNMRGHGENAKELGYFALKDGYKLLLEDQKVITNYILNKYNTNKVIILAHSMGTIITRNLIQTESKNYEKIILIGYPNYQPIMKLGVLLAKTIKIFKGGKHYSKMINDLSVGSFNKSIKNPKTKLDWLSFNEENVRNYISDPLCGFEFKLSAFIDLFKLLCNMNKTNNLVDINNIPILLLSGDSDPCCGGEKGKANSIKAINKMGFTITKEITYNKMRHEILNEKNNVLVFKDIINFLGKDIN